MTNTNIKQREEHLKDNVLNPWFSNEQLINLLVDDDNYTLYTIPKEMDAKIKSHGIWLKTKGKEGVRLDLTGQSLYNGYYVGLDLRKAILKNVSAHLCNFRHTDFSGADMSGADLGTCTFNSARFYNTNLTKSCIRNSSFEGANLRRANLTESIVSNCTFGHAWIKNVNFIGAILNNLNCYSSLVDRCNFKHARTSNIGLVEAYVGQNIYYKTQCTNWVYAEGKVLNERKQVK